MRVGLPTLGVTSLRISAESGPPPPGPPSTNLVEHWKLNTGLTQSGGFVSAWTGQVAGTVLAQADSANRPSVDGSGILTFGFDTWTQALAGPLTLAQPYTIYLLAKITDVTSGGSFFTSTDAAGSFMYLGAGFPPDVVVIYAGGSEIRTAPTQDVFQVLQGVFNDTSSLVQVDAETAATGAAGTGGLSGDVILGWNNDWDSATATMQVKEVLLYSVAHNDTQRADVRDYLATV